MLPSRKTPAWTFARKFALWLADQGLNITSAARELGIPQPTLYRYAKHNRRLTADVLARIAARSNLSADYWLDNTAPYPPPPDYLSEPEEVLRRVRAYPPELFREVMELLANREELVMALALVRAQRQHAPHRPAPRATP